MCSPHTQQQQQWCQNHPIIMSFNYDEPEKVCPKFRKGPKPKSEAEVVHPDLFLKLSCLYHQYPSARHVYACYIKESKANLDKILSIVRLEDFE